MSECRSIDVTIDGRLLDRWEARKLIGRLWVHRWTHGIRNRRRRFTIDIDRVEADILPERTT